MEGGLVISMICWFDVARLNIVVLIYLKRNLFSH